MMNKNEPPTRSAIFRPGSKDSLFFFLHALKKNPPIKKHEGPNQMNYEKKLFITG